MSFFPANASLVRRLYDANKHDGLRIITAEDARHSSLFRATPSDLLPFFFLGSLAVIDHPLQTTLIISRKFASDNVFNSCCVSR